jgi:hypothetical protein
LNEALEWIADDHPLTLGCDLHALLQAVAALDRRLTAVPRAARQLARQVTASELDTAAVLLQPETIVPADAFRAALEVLAQRCPDRTLSTITPSAVIAAQNDHPLVVETLCAVAGLTYGDLVARVGVELPTESAAHWGPSQVRAAFEVLDGIVNDRVTTALPGAVPSQPLELMPSIGDPGVSAGWEGVEQLRSGGVSYEVLLAQRVAGGTWLAHRNKTSGRIAHSIAAQLCRELDARGVSHCRATSAGGRVGPTTMRELSGAGKQVGLVAMDPRGAAAYGVVFAVARDSGSASKSAARLRTMQRGQIPIALLLAGPGWSARNETGDLALHFEGRVFSELGLHRLADEMATQTARGTST